jgi:hypothetical protein
MTQILAHHAAAHPFLPDDHRPGGQMTMLQAAG